MSQKILVIAGKKQSGKSTAANFVVGYTITQLSRQGTPYLPKNFAIDDETGVLSVNTPPWDLENNDFTSSSILDLDTNNVDYAIWAGDCMYPYVKTYAYTSLLKEIGSVLFGIPSELSNGTEEDKKTPTKFKWKDMCPFLPPKRISDIKKAGKYDDKMLIREFLQYFGTNVCRKLYPDCWLNACFNNIEIDQSNLAIIQDARFSNEIKGAKKRRSDDVSVKIVKLERAPIMDIHASETGLDKLHNNNFDLIIPKNVTIKEKNMLILDAMYSWGWFDKHYDLVMPPTKIQLEASDNE